MSLKRMFALLFSTLLSLSLLTVAHSAQAEPITTAPEFSAMEQGTSCVNIGNGDVCIRVGDIVNNRADISVWFTKKAGDPVFVRLAWFPGPRYDEGGFWISAGEVRGYVWRNQLLYDYYCFTGAILQDPPNWLVAIKGGTVCR